MKLSELMAGMHLEQEDVKELFHKHLDLALSVDAGTSTHHCEVISVLITKHYQEWMGEAVREVLVKDWPAGWGLVLEALAKNPEIGHGTAQYLLNQGHLVLTTHVTENLVGSGLPFGAPFYFERLAGQFLPIYSREQRDRAARALLSYSNSRNGILSLPQPTDSAYYRAPMYRVWIEWIERLEPDQKERWDHTYSACVNGLGQISDPEA